MVLEYVIAAAVAAVKEDGVSFGESWICLIC